MLKATANAKESIEWGTKLVGGVTPGRDGEHLGLPVLPTVRAVGDLITYEVHGDHLMQDRHKSISNRMLQLYTFQDL